MKTVQVTVAGREYVISPLPIKKNREWREQFDAPIRDAAKLLAEVGSYVDKDFNDARTMVTDIGRAVSGSLSPVVGHLLGSADLISKAVFDYSPDMKKDKKHIEENGYDDELVSCFITILGLAYPFGPALKGLSKLGQTALQTEASSATPSSESEKES